MSTFCHFDVAIAQRGQKQRIAIVFTHASKIGTKAVAEELKSLFSDAFVPKRTIFIGIKDAEPELRGLLESDDLKHVHLPFDPKDVELFLFSESGRLVEAGNHDVAMSSELVTAIRRQGMTSIFVKRDGLMRAGHSYHYVKPSGGHSRFFLRPGNIMQRGAEVAFIAAWILPFITKFTSIIYSDTASITQVAYAAVTLARRLGICNNDPSIQSFSSYGGMDGEEKFAPEHEALVLISASTSGNLRARAIEAGASPQNVVSLFSMADSADCLCDLRFHENGNPEGVQSFDTHSKRKCPECQSGSLPILIAGDSFLPETPEPRLKLLRRTDKPKWLDRVIKEIEGKGVIRCYRPLPEGQDAGLFLDLSRICKRVDNLGIFQLPLSRVVSIGVDVIVHLPDKASELLAKNTIKTFKQKTTRKPKLLGASDDLDAKLASISGAKEKCLSVLVIASCVAGGFKLLAVSRALRNVANRISYFVGLAMPPTSQAWEELKSNLELRNDGHGRNPIELVWSAQLPKAGPSENDSWMEERRWLEEQDPTTLCPTLQARLSLLRNEANSRVGGLNENSLLVSPTGKVLKLAGNFAFHQSTRLSQADVYFIVTAILHSLRDPLHPNGLRQSLNSHVLLAPNNFDRYNDGVLQATLLRAAKPSELAYINHPEASRSMVELIARMVPRSQFQDGEPLPEFLMALVTQRMKLCLDDMVRLSKMLDQSFEGHDYLSGFLPGIRTLAS